MTNTPHTDDEQLREQIEELLDITLFHEGEGPNGSLGDFYVDERDEYGNNIKLSVKLMSLIHKAQDDLLERVEKEVIGDKNDKEYRLIHTDFASPRREKVHLSDGISRNNLRAEQRFALRNLKPNQGVNTKDKEGV